GLMSPSRTRILRCSCALAWVTPSLLAMKTLDTPSFTRSPSTRRASVALAGFSVDRGIPTLARPVGLAPGAPHEQAARCLGDLRSLRRHLRRASRARRHSAERLGELDYHRRLGLRCGRS